jgi:translation initiation factor IF-3
VERFLRHKDKVKITIMFRGREVTHPERGVMILDRLAEDLGDLAVVEQRPIQDGRNMTMLLGPSKAVLAGTFDDDVAAAEASAAASAAADAAADAAAEAEARDTTGTGSSEALEPAEPEAAVDEAAAPAPVAEKS